jgi:Domain of unknown function (DUF4404)
MSDRKLRQLLAQVHERLNHATSIDAPARKLLTAVMHDVERILSQQDKDAAAVPPRLESLAVKFQTEHPALADTLRQLADILSKAGI